ncbi:Far upstream element-binding protein [Thalictrum thalictroides]|uniref:Far upstream element-binding protein n=1 Tax=Thalictrum thalictroides TaxID=46969 RepID=A0A7J6V0D5_THATH|nr:Far upstream element-binding protein [Thalictrum thalictroides]
MVKEEETAEEHGFSSETNGNNNNKKRKIEDISSAKQRAQDFISRIVSDAEIKRPKIEDSTTSSPPPFVPLSSSGQLSENSQIFTSFPTQPSSHYGFQSTSRSIDIPNGKVGVIIGKAGETIKSLQLQSGARIQVAKDTEVDPYAQTRGVELFGTQEQISRAEQLIKEVIAESDVGSSGSSAARGFATVPYGSEEIVKVPNNKVAMVIGKQGETIKNMQSKSGARIQVIPLRLPPGDMSTERNVHIYGTKEQIEVAKGLVTEVISENRARNPSLGNNQMQQPYYTPGNWVPPVQPSAAQPGYGYTQPGAYETPPPAYYGVYPPQPVGWDQSNPSGPPQSTTNNYYGQQDQTGSTTSYATLSYGQTQSTGQSYEQGYSHQPPTYGQPNPTQVLHNDQQKANATSGQPSASSQLDGTIPSQPHAAQSTVQPPAYQVSYGQPPTSAPTSVYGPPSYTTHLPPHPGYEHTAYTQSGYGGQLTVHLPSTVQSQPPISQPVYGQVGYPPQPSPVQSNYYQGTTVYGQMPYQVQAQQQPKMYTPSLVHAAERNGDNGTVAPHPSSTACSSVKEEVHSQK